LQSTGKDDFISADRESKVRVTDRDSKLWQSVTSYLMIGITKYRKG
jgi:hypothetical protein